ncbi:MAG: hypothetical protein WC523_04595 [Patescibacteria group bacterium]
MIKVKLYFTLTGKTDEWRQYISPDIRVGWRNSNTLDYVKDIITKQFGQRPTSYINEKNLANDSVPYPRYFSAGWFISDGDETKELVVVTHGESMEKANKLLMHHIKTIDWDNLSKEV